MREGREGARDAVHISYTRMKEGRGRSLCSEEKKDAGPLADQAIQLNEIQIEIGD